MTDDLKTKTPEQIMARSIGDSYDGDADPEIFPRNYSRGLSAAQAALQAIHDEGQAIVPNGVVDALKTAEAWLTTWGSHVGNCAGGTRCTCGLEAVSAEIGHAIFQASQPKTEGEGT